MGHKSEYFGQKQSPGAKGKLIGYKLHHQLVSSIENDVLLLSKMIKNFFMTNQNLDDLIVIQSNDLISHNDPLEKQKFK